MGYRITAALAIGLLGFAAAPIHFAGAVETDLSLAAAGADDDTEARRSAQHDNDQEEKTKRGHHDPASAEKFERAFPPGLSGGIRADL